MTKQVKQIANRHVARCLSRIDDVFDLPQICADTIRKEINFCAQDVENELLRIGGESKGNR